MKWSTFGKALWIGTKIAFKAASVLSASGVSLGKKGDAVVAVGGAIIDQTRGQMLGNLPTEQK